MSKKVECATRMYGSSDDLVEFDGGVMGEVGSFGSDDREKGILVMFDDGTVAEIKYCKNTPGVWGIGVLNKGSRFDRLEICTDENAEVYSDELFLKPGVTKAWAATDDWEAVS